MPGYVCTIAGGKGGVGKTTTAVNLGASLQAAGHDTVVVDADLGVANLARLLDVYYEHSVHEVLADEVRAVDALTEAGEGLTVLPGQSSLEAFAEADPAGLREVIQTLRERFDAVVVDTGGGLSHETAVPLGLADGTLLVTTPEAVAFADTFKTAELTERVGGRVIGALITRVSPETELGSIGVEFDFPLLGLVPEDVEAAGDEPLIVTAPDSEAADAYTRVTDQLERTFFDGVDPADLEQVYDPEWVGQVPTDTDEDEDEDGSEDDEPDDSDESHGTDDDDDGPPGGPGLVGLRTG